jgi:hypothetical protein
MVDRAKQNSEGGKKPVPKSDQVFFLIPKRLSIKTGLLRQMGHCVHRTEYLFSRGDSFNLCKDKSPPKIQIS